MNIKIYIYGVLAILFAILVGFAIWLVKDRERLKGYEQAYNVQSAALENATKFVQTHTSL